LNIKLRKDIGDKLLITLKETAEDLNNYAKRIMEIKSFEEIKGEISLELLDEKINELKLLQGTILALDLMEENPEKFFMEVKKEEIE
jgi:hypothetical protein